MNTKTKDIFLLNYQKYCLSKFLIVKMSFALKYPLVGKGCVTLPGGTQTNVYSPQRRPWRQTDGRNHPTQVCLDNQCTYWDYLWENGWGRSLTGTRVTQRQLLHQKLLTEWVTAHKSCIPRAPWGTCRQLHTRVSFPSATACGLWGGAPWGPELWPAWASSVSSASWVLYYTMVRVLCLHLWWCCFCHARDCS